MEMDLHSGACPVLLHITQASSGLETYRQEGTFTAVVGMIGFFMVPPTPADMPFLTTEQKQAYLRGLKEDRSEGLDSEDEPFRWSEVISIFTNAPHIIILCFPFFCSGVVVSYARRVCLRFVLTLPPSSIVPLLSSSDWQTCQFAPYFMAYGH